MRFSQLRLGTATGIGMRTGVAVALGIALGVGGFALYHSGPGAITGGAKPASPTRVATPDHSRASGMSGRGLDITEVIGGQIAYTLKVGGLRFESAPLGFLRVGFRQMVVLEDARLTMNLPAESPGGISSAWRAVESALVAPVGQRQDGVRLGPIGGFAGVIATPLRIQITRAGREILVLESERANLDLHGKQLDLEGQARLSAEGGVRALESETLHVSLETQQVWTDGAVRVRTPEGHFEVQGFRGDVSLRTVAVRSAMPGEAKRGLEQRLGSVGKEPRP